jgi:DNA repair protein RadC
MADQPHDGTGHRARLRRRLFQDGPLALHDHELVEYLLALTIPRRDTKALAKSLIARFGSVGALLSAPPDAIARVGKLSESSVAALKIAEAAALHLLKAGIDNKPVLGNWQALLDYLHARMAHQSVEQVRVLYLNAKNVLISDDVLSEGSVDEAAVYVREIVRRALECHATALILVHNHPSGDPQPSRQDIQLTRDIIDATQHLKISVHDHVIVGSKGHSSLRAMGLI